MPWIERVRTEQPLDAAIDPTWARRLIDGFVGAPGITLAGKAITDTANITKGAFPLGVGRSGAANAGFSFPCDLSSQNAITVVFQFIQRARAGVEILIEHSTDQNTNAGSFIFFTNPGANTLIFAASTGGTSDQGTVPIPALNQVHTVAARLRFSSSTTAADDIKIFINGVAPAFTPTGSTNSAINFGNYSTYFLSRAASSLQTNGVVGMYAVLSGFSSDGELASLSANPWQLFQKERIFVPVASGPVTHDTTGALAGQLGSVAGTSAHIAVHGTSGALAGQGSSVVGLAARFRAFSTSGVLTGQGAVVVGSAARTGGAVTHDATGTLTGQLGSVAGTAAHIAIHGTSGVLVGQASALSGTAVHNVPHSTSGDLVGSGAVIVGSAFNGIASITKSGVNRLWLINYYTKAFAEQEKIRAEALPVPKTKVAAKKRAAEVARKIEASVAKAEKELDSLARGVKDIQAAQAFIYNAVQQAQSQPVAEPVDFSAVVDRFRKKMQQEENELLLLAMVL